MKEVKMKLKQIEKTDDFSSDPESWTTRDSDDRFVKVVKTDEEGKLEMLKDKLNEIIKEVNNKGEL